jgi:adenosine deaminase
MDALTRFITTMPKVELHVHIEGTLEPELMMELARRNGVALPYADIEEIRKAYNFNSLQDFLDVYYQGMSVLVTTRDFFDLAFAYLSRMHEQNVSYVEFFFDPQGHTSRGIDFDTVISGLVEAQEKALRDFGLRSKLIMCFLRHLSEEEAFSTLKDACRCKDHILAVGLDSSEKGHPPSKFSRVFKEARENGFIAVAHAGEEGPSTYVCEALDDLHIRRVDHGNRALEDGALVQRLVREQIPLTICPLSNKRLQVCPDLAAHPLRKMLEMGLLVTVNSDDPSYFGGYLTDNFIAIQQALALDASAIISLGRNGFKASFLSVAEKQAALDGFDRFVERFDWRNPSL